ncbi:2-thiouracil desulfurase family protein [Candidatus Babeliales bacterium]|nr:2-thiouracil desulfurase family protein [Candidatus Babeliales bacterium]
MELEVNMSNSKTKKIFFISECLLNQNIRAYGVGNMKGSGSVADIVDLLKINDIGFSVVPCPEIPYEGLKRFACGKSHYNNEKYRAICSDLAGQFIERYKLYIDDNYKIGGFICVNGSPSCACDYCYDGEDGHTKCMEPGVFVEEIQKKLKKENLSLNFIGVRIKELDSVLEKIKNSISKL